MRDLTTGDKLDQYQLADLLARSGMASIFKATDTESGATVALKIPHVQFESDVVFFQRFGREEQIGQKLDHPNIVKILKPRDKSRMYIAMEYVDGVSLRAMMSAQGKIAPDRALELARQVCDALAYLHRQGVVHRDIKPENILVTADGRVKLLDFGIAMDQSARRLTWFGLSNPMGTPDYMAPEQINGRRGDARTDVYALGVLLYEMVTGALPFTSANPHALVKMKTTEAPTPPSYHLPGIDPGLEAIVMKAIERAPRDRYPSAAELLTDLNNPAAVPPHQSDAASARGRGARPLVPRRLRVPLIVAVVVAALMTMVWLSGRTPAHAPPGAPPRAK